MRLLIILVGIALLYLVLKSYFRNLQQPTQVSQAQQPSLGEDMVRCVVCGVNTPRSEAIHSGGDYFCCNDHYQSRRK